ncbi:MAG: hypothetical protein WCV62_02610 [Candidatus Peribacteraceae bacterium]|jgi:hypothetical protein
MGQKSRAAANNEPDQSDRLKLWGPEQERIYREHFMGPEPAEQQFCDPAINSGIKRFGRPTKYREEFCAMAYHMLADPRMIFTLRSVAARLGVSYDTLDYWRRRYPDFCHALAQGKAVQEEWLATCLVNGWGNPQGILILLYCLHKWRKDGRRSEDAPDGLQEALAAQTASTRHVVWEKARPA